MTPKEKAIELVDKFIWNPQTADNKLRAKQCALIAADELIAHTYDNDIVDKYDYSYEYWQQVKEEIKSL